MKRSGRRDPVPVRVPGDKSLTHRALILASLAEGESRIREPLVAADTTSTARALQALGVAVEGWPAGAGPGTAPVVVRGRGTSGWRRPEAEIDCGNSGTTARLLLGALAGCPFDAVLTGDESLRARPMRRVTAPLTEGGATFQELGEPDRLPIRVRGVRPLKALDHQSPHASAQVKSALILAGLTGNAAVRVSEPGLSRDHTERMLAAMGVVLEVEQGPGPTVHLPVPHGPGNGVRSLRPMDFTVPGDPSSAAFLLGLAALLGPVRALNVGLNPTRTGFLDVLRRMGVRLEVDGRREAGGEPVGDIVADAGPLAGTTVDPGEVPALLDEIPLLAALAATADGCTRFQGIGELRVKETDRIAAMVENLRALGVDVEDGPDWLAVTGTTSPLRGEVRSFHDHRIAMAFGVLGAVPGNDIRVEGADAVDISYPGFWDELERVEKELRGT